MNSKTLREVFGKGYYPLVILRLLAEHSPRYATTFYRLCEEGDENCKRAVRSALERLTRRGILYRKRERGTWKWVYGLSRRGREVVAFLFIERTPS